MLYFFVILRIIQQQVVISVILAPGPGALGHFGGPRSGSSFDFSHHGEEGLSGLEQHGGLSDFGGPGSGPSFDFGHHGEGGLSG